MNDCIDVFRQVIVQIATPYSTGTGFYLKNPDIIVTNYHVVEGNSSVIIEGPGFERQQANVIYADRKYDLAFLLPPEQAAGLPEARLAAEDKTLRERDPVTAIGHPFGLKFSVKSGIVSSTRELMNNIPYLHIDVALNPGNSGGPLVDNDGEIIGVNTFIIRNGDNMGFSLPVGFLRETIHEFAQCDSRNAARCLGCANILSERQVVGGFCTHCGHKMQLPADVDTYTPTGIPRLIESLIDGAGHQVPLSRCGPNAWEIRQGSARINITYHEKSGLMTADAVLCRLPKENIKPLYEYLLRENYSNEALSFSVREQDVLLSVLVYDRYLNDETGRELLQNLFAKADHYDNILIEQFGAGWKEV